MMNGIEKIKNKNYGETFGSKEGIILISIPPSLRLLKGRCEKIVPCEKGGQGCRVGTGSAGSMGRELPKFYSGTSSR
jgi:hypothetical protein